MSTLNALSDPQALPQAMDCVHDLEQLLEQEFEALRTQEIDRFDDLAQSKSELLTQLGQITGIQDKSDADQLDGAWDGFRTQMLHCRQLHQRNQILLMRKLDAIRGALDSLQMTDPTSSLEVYDRRTRRSSMGYSAV
jgi:flagellar biosynthesis/type III secretory pathway chaperone